MITDEMREKYPHMEKFWPYLDVLNAESQRGKVLVSVGFLEQQLKDILLSFALECPQAEELVEGGNAPLGTLGSRISACYVLGLITRSEFDDLQLIRKIRNDFAHNLHTTFETQSVVNRCRELKHSAKDAPGEKNPIPPAGQFHTAAVDLIMNFINRPHYVRKQKRTAERWPR